MLRVAYLHGVAYCLSSFLILVCWTSNISLIQAGIMVANRQEWNNSIILIPPVLPFAELTSTKLLTPTSVPSWFRTSLVVSTGRLPVPTTKSHLQRQPRLEHSDQPIIPTIFIAISLAGLVIIVIVGIFLMNKCLNKRRMERTPAENNHQYQVDCNLLVQSSSSVEIDPEGDPTYHNDIDLSSAPNTETIVDPKYATVEFLSRCSIVEDYANTFRVAGFLESDPIVYAEIEIQKVD